MDLERAFDIKFIKTGHFKLSSGLHSDKYIQAQEILSEPSITSVLADRIIEQIRVTGLQKIECVIAPAIGAITFGHELARKYGARFYIAERENGKLTLRRNQKLPIGSNVLIAEDVITTCGTADELKELVKASDCFPIAVACIIDRGGAALKSDMNHFSVQKISAKTFKEDECELCKQGIVLETPGSRFKEK